MTSSGYNLKSIRRRFQFNMPVHFQALWDTVSDEEHRHLAAQGIHGFSNPSAEASSSPLVDSSKMIWALQQCRGDGHTLPLSAGEADSSLADLCLVALGKVLDDFVNARHPAGLHSHSKVAFGAPASSLSRRVPAKSTASWGTPVSASGKSLFDWKRSSRQFGQRTIRRAVERCVRPRLVTSL